MKELRNGGWAAASVQPTERRVYTDTHCNTEGYPGTMKVVRPITMPKRRASDPRPTLEALEGRSRKMRRAFETLAGVAIVMVMLFMVAYVS